MRSRCIQFVQVIMRFLLVPLLCTGLSACGNETVVPPQCREVEGQIWAIMTEGVRADSANKALSSLGVEFDSGTLRDCFTIYFKVVSGSPSEYLRDLQMATQAGVVGVSTNNQVFAAICASEPSMYIEQGTSVPGLEYDHLSWHSLETTLQVPVGEEGSWVARLLEHDFILAAGQVIWCPI